MTIRRDALARTLVALTSVVAVAGLTCEVAHHTVGANDELVDFLSLSEEANLPTWYAAVLLFSCALLLAHIASGERERGRWWGLAAGFAYMSLDEVAQLHERLNDVVTLHGPLRFGWVVFGAAAVGVVAVLYLPFLARLPRPTRARFLVAGALYVVGALVMELPLGWYAEHVGEDVWYFVIDAAEETLELAGATLFLLALVDHARRGGRTLELTVEDDR